MGKRCGESLTRSSKQTKGRPIRTVHLMVISEPEADTRTVLKYTGPGTAIFSGNGNVTMLCGHCGESPGRSSENGDAAESRIGLQELRLVQRHTRLERRIELSQDLENGVSTHYNRAHGQTTGKAG